MLEHIVHSFRIVKMLENQTSSDHKRSDESKGSFDAKQSKRKLMPLRVQNSAAIDGISQIDYDPTARIKPDCPYLETSSSKPNPSPSGKKPTVMNDENVNPVENQISNPLAKDQSLQPALSESTFEPQESSLKQIENQTETCFVEKIKDRKKKQVLAIPSKNRSLVCTYMHRKDVDFVADAIKSLGGFYAEPQVTRATSHIVCGDEKRTINLLRGIAHGCWIVNYEWVIRSVDAGQWIDEEPFELKKFPSIHQCRVARETFGHKNDVFNGELIYVAQKTCPPRCDIVELLHLCGGIIVNSASKANVIVSPFKLRSVPLSATQVNENWVLDSIQENMMQSKLRYSYDRAS